MSEIKNLLAKMINKINSNEDRIENIEENGSGVTSWNDLTDKPFGEETKEVEMSYVSFSGEWFQANQFVFQSNEYLPAEHELVLGNLYTVTINDNTINDCECIEFEYSGSTVTGLRVNVDENISLKVIYIPQDKAIAIGGDSAFYIIEIVDRTITVDDYVYNTSVTVSGKSTIAEIKSIDPKYLPEGYPYIEVKEGAAEFDGIFEGREYIDLGGEIILVKISDDVFTEEDLIGSELTFTTNVNLNNGNVVDEYSDTFTVLQDSVMKQNITENDYLIGVMHMDLGIPMLYIIVGDTSPMGIVIPQGTYYPYLYLDEDIYVYTRSVSCISGLIETVNRINPKFLPEGYPYIEGGKTSSNILEWDGNTDGLTSVEIEPGVGFYKVSDTVIEASDLVDGILTRTDGVEIQSAQIPEEYIEDIENAIMVGNAIIIIKEDETEIDGFIFPESGIYFMYENGIYTTKLELTSKLFIKNGEIIHKLDSRFLPDNIATIEYVDELKNFVSDGKTLVANAITAKGIITATNATFATMANNIENIKTGANVNGDVKSYTIASGETINEGDFVSLVDNEIVIYNGTVFGVAIAGGVGGDIIEVFEPFNLMVKLEITTPPTKMIYTQDESLNTEGMVITATYLDGTTKEITNYTYSPDGILEQLGSRTVTISYTEHGLTKTCAIDVEVTFGPSVALKDFVYTDNGNGTYTITDWKGTKDGVASTELIIPNNKCIIL